MIEEINTMVKKLGSANDISQMVEQEDAIAQLAANGFMEGNIGYTDMEDVKDDLENIETGLRKKFEVQKSQPQIHNRSSNVR